MRQNLATIIATLTFVGTILLAVAVSIFLGWGASMLGIIIMGLAVIPTTLFLIRYMRVAWWRTIEGRHLVGMAAVIDVILIEQIAIQLIPGPQYWHWPFITVTLVAVALLMWQRYIMLILAQREVRKEREHWQRAARREAENRTER